MFLYFFDMKFVEFGFNTYPNKRDKPIFIAYLFLNLLLKIVTIFGVLVSKFIYHDFFSTIYSPLTPESFINPFFLARYIAFPIALASISGNFCFSSLELKVVCFNI